MLLNVDGWLIKQMQLLDSLNGFNQALRLNQQTNPDISFAMLTKAIARCYRHACLIQQ